MFELMESDRLSPEEARIWLEQAVAAELARIRDRRLAAHDRVDPAERADDRLVDELAAHAYRLLARHGASAEFSPTDDVEIAARGFTTDDLRRGRNLLETLRRDFWSDARHARTRSECGRVLGREAMPPMLYMDLRRIKLEGRAIAYQASLEDDAAHDLTPAVDATKAQFLQQAKDNRLMFASPTCPVATTKASSGAENQPDASYERANTKTVSADTQDNTYSRALLDVTERLIAKKRKSGTQDKTLAQIAQIMEAFVEISGVTDVADLRQDHVSQYIDTLGTLPKSYRKSPKDHDKPISYFVELAQNMPPGDIGLSVNTINRNLGFIGMVLKRARSEGHVIDSQIDLTELREKKSRRVREEWRAFTPQDVQLIFENPLWTGCFSRSRRRRPGKKVLKDAHFFVPLIAALSGARREEIAGLAPGDIQEIDGIWCFDIRPNALRGVKNDNAERIVPIHSQLIALGLLDRARKRLKERDLFPELRPSKENGSYGEQIDHLFRQVVIDQVPDRERKSFHSFRHYVVDVLTNLNDLRAEHRDDILGHEGQGMGATRYGSGTNIVNRKAVIERLPRIIALDGL